MDNRILSDNESTRINVSLPLLICFSLYGVWQMGVIYYSGTAASISGRMPFPVDVGNLSVLVAVGYLLSITWLILFPRSIVWAERGTAAAALLSGILLFFPFSDAVLTVLYCFHCFCCVFMVGFETSLLVNLLSEQSVLWYLMLAYPVGFAMIAVFQNDFFPIPFAVFQLLIILTLSLMLIFFWKLPTKVWPAYVKKEDGLQYPKRLFAGMLLLVTMGSFVMLLGGAVAENTKHGLFLFYLAGAGGSLLAWVLWKRFAVTPIRIGSFLACIAAIGFLLSVVSLTGKIPAVSLIACALLGCGAFVCNLSMYYGFVMMRQYPSKWISPIIISINLGVMVLHTSLLEWFRESPNVLYTLYLIIAVTAVILYLALEPYLTLTFRSQPFIEPTAPKADASPAADDKKESISARAYDKLTAVELLIAERIMRGYSSREIAAELGYSENTIKSYRKDLYSKLQIHSRRELFELAEKCDGK